MKIIKTDFTIDSKIEKKRKPKKITKPTKSKWEQNADKLRAFQDKQRALMAKLESEGYQANAASFMRFDKTPKRISEKYLTWYKKAYSTAAIKRQYYKDVTTLYTRYADEKNVALARVRASEREATQRKKIAKGTADRLIKDTIYAMKHGYHKADIADNTIRTIRNLEKSTGVKIMPKMRFDDAKRNLVKTLTESVNKKALEKALAEYDKTQGRDDFLRTVTVPYTVALTPKEIQRERAESYAKARKTLQSRWKRVDEDGNVTGLSDDDIDKLMDFFETDAWQNFKKAKKYRYNPELIWALRDEVTKQGSDPALFIDIFESDGNLDSSLRKYREAMSKRE